MGRQANVFLFSSSFRDVVSSRLGSLRRLGSPWFHRIEIKLSAEGRVRHEVLATSYFGKASLGFQVASTEALRVASTIKVTYALIIFYLKAFKVQSSSDSSLVTLGTRTSALQVLQVLLCQGSHWNRALEKLPPFLHAWPGATISASSLGYQEDSLWSSFLYEPCCITCCCNGAGVVSETDSAPRPPRLRCSQSGNLAVAYYSLRLTLTITVIKSCQSLAAITSTESCSRWIHSAKKWLWLAFALAARRQSGSICENST